MLQKKNKKRKLVCYVIAGPVAGGQRTIKQQFFNYFFSSPDRLYFPDIDWPKKKECIFAACNKTKDKWLSIRLIP